MTIDELRSRHRELLARKKEELALQAEGRGDNMALFMVQEELLEVNAQLRALTPQRRVGTRRVSHSDYLPDRQQYIDWDRENQSLDDEIEDGRQAMLKAVTRSWEILTPKQRQIMELSQAGARRSRSPSGWASISLPSAGPWAGPSGPCGRRRSGSAGAEAGRQAFGHGGSGYGKGDPVRHDAEAGCLFVPVLLRVAIPAGDL